VGRMNAGSTCPRWRADAQSRVPRSPSCVTGASVACELDDIPPHHHARGCQPHATLTQARLTTRRKPSLCTHTRRASSAASEMGALGGAQIRLHWGQTRAATAASPSAQLIRQSRPLGKPLHHQLAMTTGSDPGAAVESLRLRTRYHSTPPVSLPVSRTSEWQRNCFAVR